MRNFIVVFALAASSIAVGCGGEKTGTTGLNQSIADGGGSDAANGDSGGDVDADSGPRVCTGPNVTSDIGSLDLANYICKSPNDCTICVQTVDDQGAAVQWFDFPLAHCVCPTPTVRTQHDQ
jgi:hypothetical protein